MGFDDVKSEPTSAVISDLNLKFFRSCSKGHTAESERLGFKLAELYLSKRDFESILYLAQAPEVPQKVKDFARDILRNSKPSIGEENPQSSRKIEKVLPLVDGGSIRIEGPRSRTKGYEAADDEPPTTQQDAATPTHPDSGRYSSRSEHPERMSDHSDAVSRLRPKTEALRLPRPPKIIR
jgi:hypothetical protein